VGAGGDTYIIDCPADCRIGYSGPNDAGSDYFLGIAGDPYDSGAPIPHSGTKQAPTRILGKNYANCISDDAKAHINGGYGVSSVFNLRAVSYVDLACLAITDHSSCNRISGMVNQCKTTPPRSDYATNGITTSKASTNVSITDVRVHGMIGNGMKGPTGDGVVVERVALVGNHMSGWDMDPGDGTTGTGNVLLDHMAILWNGCSEEYPIVDALPYKDCNDDYSGGYGDGLGTATVTSNPAWHMTVSNSVVAYNTQDGLDLLHLQGNGSTLTVTDSLMYANMGQQLKVGAASTSRNNLIVGNCNALRQPIPGTPAGYNSHLSDFCRADNTMVALTVQDSTPTYFQNNTMLSANATGVQIGCDGTCSRLASIVYQNNIFVGFPDNPANGDPHGNGENANPIYLVNMTGLFSHPGTIFSHNATFHQRSNWTCPKAAFDEKDAICADPEVTDETWHLYGYGDMSPVANSPVVGKGEMISGLTTDYRGVKRPDPPTIGALETGPNPVPQEIVLEVLPNPATTNGTVLLAATVRPLLGSSTLPTGAVMFLDGNSSRGVASLNNLGEATLDVSKFSIGSHGIMAVYSGDGKNPAWGSGITQLQVNSPTTTSLAALPTSVVYGASLTLTATVRGTGSTTAPVGTVAFYNGTTKLGSATVSSAGVATLSIKSLGVRNQTLTARYSGSTNYLGSVSAVVGITVKK
jgi:hypothetical protein